MMLQYRKEVEIMVIKLKSIRIRQGLTIRDLAAASGVSKTYISEIERGEKIPTIEILCKLARAMGVRCEELYSCDVE